ncbi:MAG: MBL fold metallo-hydrolase [Syntrophomonas sp.]
MRIRWLGHASFLIELQGGKILTDPSDEKYGYPVFTEDVDLVTVSHEHQDHNAVHMLKGNPRVIRGEGIFEWKDIIIRGTSSFHDKNQGKLRGRNTIYKISAEGLDLVHLGDLGDILTTDQLKQIGNVDILMLPVGGVYTVDAEGAFENMKLLKPRIIIPMHFKTPHLTIDLGPLEAFTSKFDRIVKRPYLDISKDALSAEPLVIVLDYM